MVNKVFHKFVVARNRNLVRYQC